MKNKYVIFENDKKIYFARHITYGMNHFVRNINEARHFRSYNEALNYTIKYNLKNCTILKEV